MPIHRILAVCAAQCAFITTTVAATEAVEPEADTAPTSDWRATVDSLEARLRQLEKPQGGASESPPLRARLADGLILEDGAGEWSLRATARAMADYRAYS